jgi:RecJ-like exonuclease
LDAASTTGTVTGLTTATNYDFKLVVVEGANAGDSNVVLNVATDPTPVSDFANTAVTDATATFTWTAATGATSVKIQQSPAGTSTWTDSTTGALDATSTTGTVTGLTTATNYDFKLVVVGGANAGDSNVVLNVATA